MRPLRLALVAAAGLCLTDAFYLPGVAVHEYAQDERVDIKVNKLTSTKTQYVPHNAAAALCHCCCC